MNPVSATLETIQAGIDKLIQVVDTVFHNEEELARRLDRVDLNAEAIAKHEQERRQENADLARQLETVRHNTEAIAKNEYELRQENTELRILVEAGFLRFAVRVDAVDFRAFAAIMLTGNRYQAADSLQIPQTTFWKKVET